VCGRHQQASAGERVTLLLKWLHRRNAPANLSITDQWPASLSDWDSIRAPPFHYARPQPRTMTLRESQQHRRFMPILLIARGFSVAGLALRGYISAIHLLLAPPGPFGSVWKQGLEMQHSYSQYIPPMYNWPPKSLWSHGVPEMGEWEDRSIYFHFPFCRNICDFCEYETRKIHNIDKINIISSYLKQIEWNGQFVRRSGNINSIFFGGGTASLMPPAAIEKILDRVASFGGLDERTEITLECEPGTLGKKRLKELRAAGVNRISVCAQSFDDEVLINITRIHSGTDAIKLERCPINLHRTLRRRSSWRILLE
jgi:hypothetical protein